MPLRAKRWPWLLTVTTREPGAASTRSSSRPVSAKWPRWLVPNCNSKPSLVVDFGVIITPALLIKQVDGVVLGAQFIGGGADRLQRGQVEFLQRDAGAGAGRGDAVGGVLALVEVADGEHDVRALGGERRGGLVAEAGVGAGDDGRAAGLVGNVGGCPFGHVGLLVRMAKRSVRPG